MLKHQNSKSSNAIYQIRSCLIYYTYRQFGNRIQTIADIRRVYNKHWTVDDLLKIHRKELVDEDPPGARLLMH